MKEKQKLVDPALKGRTSAKQKMAVVETLDDIIDRGVVVDLNYELKRKMHPKRLNQDVQDLPPIDSDRPNKQHKYSTLSSDTEMSTEYSSTYDDTPTSNNGKKSILLNSNKKKLSSANNGKTKIVDKEKVKSMMLSRAADKIIKEAEAARSIREVKAAKTSKLREKFAKLKTSKSGGSK